MHGAILEVASPAANAILISNRNRARPPSRSFAEAGAPEKTSCDFEHAG
jgi:hypothetical protein